MIFSLCFNAKLNGFKTVKERADKNPLNYGHIFITLVEFSFWSDLRLASIIKITYTEVGGYLDPHEAQMW